MNKNCDCLGHAHTLNRLLLGLVMLVPGLLSIFVWGPETITGMLTAIGFPAPAIFTWLLILSEIIAGIAIIVNFQVKYAYIPPVVILTIAAFTVWFKPTEIPNFLLHIVAVTNYLVGLAHYWTPKETKE